MNENMKFIARQKASSILEINDNEVLDGLTDPIDQYKRLQEGIRIMSEIITNNDPKKAREVADFMLEYCLKRRSRLLYAYLQAKIDQLEGDREDKEEEAWKWDETERARFRITQDRHDHRGNRFRSIEVWTSAFLASIQIYPANTYVAFGREDREINVVGRMSNNFVNPDGIFGMIANYCPIENQEAIRRALSLAWRRLNDRVPSEDRISDMDLCYPPEDF